MLQQGVLDACKSGGLFNPAVSVGLWAGGRFPGGQLVPYIVAQVLGGIAAAAVLYVIATGKPGFDLVASGFAANGSGDHSPTVATMRSTWSEYTASTSIVSIARR